MFTTGPFFFSRLVRVCVIALHFAFKFNCANIAIVVLNIKRGEGVGFVKEAFSAQQNDFLFYLNLFWIKRV